MTGIELSKKWYFTIFGNMTMTKAVFDHGLTSIRGFGPRATFFSKKFYTFQKFIFSLFTGLCITPMNWNQFTHLTLNSILIFDLFPDLISTLKQQSDEAGKCISIVRYNRKGQHPSKAHWKMHYRPTTGTVRDCSQCIEFYNRTRSVLEIRQFKLFITKL